MHHSKLSINRWKKEFPLSAFERQDGPRRFSTTKPDDPLDLWKARGRIISSPADLAIAEQVRERVASVRNLGMAVPVDIFLWAVGTPRRPYLTKIGGVPHRPTSKPWPQSDDGMPMTFVCQICFLDSRDIVPQKLPGDIMLIFFKDAESHFGKPEHIHVEWSHSQLAEPISLNGCPPPSFSVPKLAGVIHRTCEYPEAGNAFASLGHYQDWLFATTQSTKIGRATWFIQNDPRRKGEILLATFNSLQPEKKWPFTNREALPPGTNPDGGMHGFGNYTIMFGDVGCMYFLMNAKGRIRWECDCY